MKQYTVDYDFIKEAIELYKLTFPGEPATAFEAVLKEMDERKADGWVPFVVVTEDDKGAMWLKVDVTVENGIPN